MWAALGKTLLKGGAKKVATNKILNRKKKTTKRADGKEVADNIMNKEKGEKRKKGGALAVRPSMGLVATAKDFAPVSTTPGESDIVIIKKQVIQVKDILKDTHSAKLAERVRQRKAKEADKREVREDKLEKVKPTKPKIGIKMPKMAANIGNFFAWLAFGVILNSLWKFLPKLLEIGTILGPIAKFIAGAVAKTFEIIVGFIELAYAGYDKLEKLIEDIGGEEAVEKFDRFSELLKVLINGALAAAAAGLLAGKLGLGAGAGAAGAAAGGAASTVGGVSAGVAAGVVAAAGAIAVGLGEGIFALGQKGYNIEEDWKQKAASKGWWNPMKYWWGISAGLMGFTNRIFSGIGGIFDVLGAPFRMIAELIRFPFLSKEGQEKQRSNMEKYDTRIREQFRKFLNMFDFLGVIGDDKGSWGSLYGDAAGEKASKEMFGDKEEKTKKTFEVKDGKVVGGTGTQKDYEKLKKIQRLEDEADFAAEQGDWKKYEQIQKQISKLEGEKKAVVPSNKPPGAADFITSTSDKPPGAADFITSSGNDKAAGLDTHPSYAQGSMMIIENTTTYIQPIEV